jgi:quercetin dioxygenase-like cupin family protein
MITRSVNTGTLEHAHTDNRRIIFECNLPTSSVQQFVITEPIPLGNHYHKIRQETFVITNGRGRCVCLPLDMHENPLAEQVAFNISKGSVIQIMPFTAHAFRLEPGSSMVCFSSIPFDPDDPDMFSYKLEI